MEVLVDTNVRYRYRKKWVLRHCKLVRTTKYSDSVSLLVYPIENNKRSNNPKSKNSKLDAMGQFIIYGYYHGVHLDGETHVMVIVCKSSVEALGFSDFNTMKFWSDGLSKTVQGISQYVQLTQSNKHSQLKATQDCRMFLNNSHISLIKDFGNYEPKFIISWKIADIEKYGMRDASTLESISPYRSKNSHINRSQTSEKNDEKEYMNLFVLIASPLAPIAPGTHIFKCKEPKLFIGWLDKLSSDNNIAISLDSPRGYPYNFIQNSPTPYHEMMKQSSRYRTDSLNSSININHTFNRQQSHFQFNSNSTPDEQSNTYSVFNFDQFSTSCPDPQYELKEENVAKMCKKITVPENDQIKENEDEDEDEDNSTNYIDISPNITNGKQKITWLEKIPFERDPTRQPTRQMSCNVYLSSSTASRRTPYFSRTLSSDDSRTTTRDIFSTESLMYFTAARKKTTESDYCSISSFRQQSSTDEFSLSRSKNNSDSNSIPHGSQSPDLYIDPTQGLAGRRLSAKMSMSPHHESNNNNNLKSNNYADLIFNGIPQIEEQYSNSSTCSVEHGTGQLTVS